VSRRRYTRNAPIEALERAFPVRVLRSEPLAGRRHQH
jgi:hypothetical protein